MPRLRHLFYGQMEIMRYPRLMLYAGSISSRVSLRSEMDLCPFSYYHATRNRQIDSASLEYEISTRSLDCDIKQFLCLATLVCPRVFFLLFSTAICSNNIRCRPARYVHHRRRA
ncbi:hypothetical protein PUN28_017137 [Cardiocondyla obscurior]|uniref:Uncharacterized protein n=1 Tax=Cardiocondyla obscurior TaxID=286306 RepID=A0AAW2EKE3_9HYME